MNLRLNVPWIQLFQKLDPRLKIWNPKNGSDLATEFLFIPTQMSKRICNLFSKLIRINFYKFFIYSVQIKLSSLNLDLAPIKSSNLKLVHFVKCFLTYNWGSLTCPCRNQMECSICTDGQFFFYYFLCKLHVKSQVGAWNHSGKSYCKEICSSFNTLPLSGKKRLPHCLETKIWIGI